MKRINYCKSCGERVIDGKYCPFCGKEINKEMKDMSKSRRTRKILLSILVITCIITAGMWTYAIFFNEHYQTVEISETASLEMPIGKGLKGDYINGSSIYQVENGKGVAVISFNSNNPDLASLFAFAGLRDMLVGSKFNDDKLYQTTINGTTIWSIATKNNITHDNIIISTHDKEQTMKIYKSIKYNTNSTKNNTTNMPNNQNNNANTYTNNNVPTSNDVPSRTYADMANDADANTNKEKANEINNNIVGHDEKGGAFYSDGSYSPPKI